jgi:UrcA family protein
MTVSAPLAAKAAALACAVVPLMALAGAARAEGVRVQVGDLSQPEQAAAFGRNLDAAAQKVCSVYPDGVRHGGTIRLCRQAVRDEAMAQLSPAQRAELAAYAGAGRGR